MKTHIASLLLMIGAVGLVAGCSNYVPPSGKAEFSALAPAKINDAFAARPTATFPVGLAWVRLQASGYESYSTRRNGGVYGWGRYSVFTTREVEDALARIQALPEVAGVSAVSSLLLPVQLESDEPLRTAAARLKAEMLVLYTFDTTFFEKDRAIPLALISLGTAPTRKIQLHTTAAAVVLDTRTGFVYATFEVSESRALGSNLWREAGNVDEARLDAERTAFNRLVTEFEKNWPWIVERAKQGA